MKPLFLAGHPALDFLNTAFALPPERTPIELIGDGEALVAWLLAAELLDKASAAKLKRRSSHQALNEAAAEARKFRQWAGELIARWRSDPNDDYEPELRRLNGLLERASCYHELVAAKPGWKLVEHNRVDTASELLALVAARVAALIALEAPDLVKRCAGAGCVLWFVDRTKAHRRVFCSASACGNRAKVAAFRDRQRREGA